MEFPLFKDISARNFNGQGSSPKRAEDAANKKAAVFYKENQDTLRFLSHSYSTTKRNKDKDPDNYWSSISVVFSKA